MTYETNKGTNEAEQMEPKGTKAQEHKENETECVFDTGWICSQFPLFKRIKCAEKKRNGKERKGEKVKEKKQTNKVAKKETKRNEKEMKIK